MSQLHCDVTDDIAEDHPARPTDVLKKLETVILPDIAWLRAKL